MWVWGKREASGHLGAEDSRGVNRNHSGLNRPSAHVGLCVLEEMSTQRSNKSVVARAVRGESDSHA